MYYHTVKFSSVSKALFRLLHVLAIYIIVLLPVQTGLAKADHHKNITPHHHVLPKHTVVEKTDLLHKHIWNIIKNRLLSSPPSGFRIKAVANMISLVFVWLVILIHVPQQLFARYSLRQYDPVATTRKYIFNSLFLV